MTPASFRKIVWAHYKKHGRHDLPWRKTHDVYKVLVSEVMLQQTQVERVIPFYKKFIKQFQTAKKLAAVPLSQVLTAWQGLGYNRRAKMLHTAAKKLAARKSISIAGLEELPGVGPYTACAIAAFAGNKNVIFIETNIRTAIIHYFFPGKKKVSDALIEKVLIQVLPKGKSREWYSALMDYGAHLKREGISHNARSKKYVKQAKFTGSLREARGAILRALASTRKYQGEALLNVLGVRRKTQMKTALNALCTEGLVQKRSNAFVLPS